MDAVTVNVSQVEEVKSQASVSFADAGSTSERYAVPFTSPVVVPANSDLVLWFFDGAERIGRVVVRPAELSLPFGTWVQIRSEDARGASEEVSAPRAFVTISRALEEQTELPSVDHSLLHSSDGSFLSTASFFPASDDQGLRPSLRQTLEQLQEKLERDRARHSAKSKALQLKLISVRSAYEKDLWKFKLDRSHLERCFRLETNELKLGLEKATMGRRRDALVAEELRGKAAALETEVQQEREQTAALVKKYEELVSSYELSLERLKQQNQSLLAELEEATSAGNRLQSDISAAQSRILTLETTNLQLEQEVKRLRAQPPEQCSHGPELQRLRAQVGECESQRLAFPGLIQSMESSLAEAFATSLRRLEDDRNSDRKSYLSVIEDLRTELNKARRNTVSLQTREAALTTKLDSKRYAVVLQRDLRTELEEALGVNSRMSRDIAALSEKLESVERCGRDKEDDAQEWRRKWEDSCRQVAELQDASRQLAQQLTEAAVASSKAKTHLETASEQLQEAAADLAKEKERAAYLEAELSVSQEVMKTLKATHESDSREAQDSQRSLQQRASALAALVQEWQDKHGLVAAELRTLRQEHLEAKETAQLQARIGELESACQELQLKNEKLEAAHRESEAHCARLEDETQSLAEKFTEEREQQDEYLQALLEENRELKQHLGSYHEEKEELERLLNEAVAKIPAPRSDSKDMIDNMLREYMALRRIRNPFTRIAEGLYAYGSKKVSVTVKNGSLIIRVGGGYMFLEEFLKTYLPKKEDTATPRKFKIVLSPRSFASHSRSQSVGTEFKRTLTVACDSRTREETSESSSGFPTPQLSVESPLRSQRSVRDSSPTLYHPTVSSQNKVVSSPIAAKTAVFRAFKVGRSDA